MSRIDFGRELNGEQLAAVTGPDGPTLILAAAGTGKTRALVYRVAHLVQSGIPAERILLLTFTNKAAGEMLERAAELVGPGVGGMWGGTFHHMANRFLRRHGRELGFEPDYTILDRDDSRGLISECVKNRGLQSKEFPKAEVLLACTGTAANTEQPLAEVVDARVGDTPVDPAQVMAVLRDYAQRKTELGAMDFDDLLLNGLRLFRECPAVLDRYQEWFLHVLVDEYQDTNTIQAELVDRLAGRRRNVLVVGDDFQSIYSWRGADFRNIMSFPERYTDAQVHKLETNYRSVPEVLAVANACIAGNPDQFQKTLRAVREPYRKPRVVRMRDGEEQARYVCQHIAALRRSGYQASEIAVLYRAHYHALDLQMQLTRETIPYLITSGARFFEQAHIKDVCSVLRVVERSGDEIAFKRLLELLPGVGAKTVQKLWQRLGGRFLGTDTAACMQVEGWLPTGARATWKTIAGVLADYEKEGLAEDPGEIVHRFVGAFYDEHCHNAFKDAARRIDDIREMILYTAKFESTQAFLGDVALVTNLDAEGVQAADAGNGMVRLSTVHQAKGMEWAVVIVLWMADSMFPSARALSESGGGEAEERRLFYVAVTRAKDELCFCVPEVRRMRDGGVQFLEPSRFIEEIPSDLVEDTRLGFI